MRCISLYAQEDCARTLLFRGADHSVRNVSGQTAHELAINTGNIQLAEVISSFSERDVGKQCTHAYNFLFQHQVLLINDRNCDGKQWRRFLLDSGGDDMAKSGNCWGDACICVPPTKIFWGDASPPSPL